MIVKLNICIWVFLKIVVVEINHYYVLIVLSMLSLNQLIETYIAYFRAKVVFYPFLESATMVFKYKSVKHGFFLCFF